MKSCCITPCLGRNAQKSTTGGKNRMLKSTFIMFLEAYCQTTTISAKNNILNSLQPTWFGVCWEFCGIFLEWNRKFPPSSFSKRMSQKWTYIQGRSLLGRNNGPTAPTVNDVFQKALAWRMASSMGFLHCTCSDCGSPLEGLCPMGGGCKMMQDHEDVGRAQDREPNKAGLKSWIHQLLAVWPLWPPFPHLWNENKIPSCTTVVRVKWGIVRTWLSTVSRSSSLSPSTWEKTG